MIVIIRWLTEEEGGRISTPPPQKYQGTVLVDGQYYSATAELALDELGRFSPTYFEIRRLKFLVAANEHQGIRIGQPFQFVEGRKVVGYAEMLDI